MKNLYFRILTRPCFIHIGKTLTSNPGLLNFAPAMPTIFANTANPVFIPVSIFHQTMVEELRGVGGSNVKGYESKFSQNSHQYIPAQSLCSLTHYTATKNSFTLLEIITSQEKIYGPSVQTPMRGARRPPTGERREKTAARWHRRRGKRLSSTRTSCRGGYGTRKRKSPIPR